MKTIDHLAEAVITTLAYAYAHQQGRRLSDEEAAERIGDDAAGIFERVQGNKSEGSRISRADQAAIVEAAYRRGIEIVTNTR